jgi:low affinity Fe/Cu permease
VASILVVVWLIAGPLFGFSDTWQLVANTLTNVVLYGVSEPKHTKSQWHGNSG